MDMGIGVWELVLLLAIVLLLFGTKRLRNIGGDLGSAIKSFRSALSAPEEADPKSHDEEASNDREKEKDKGL